jgi:hypothetical protein
LTDLLLDNRFGDIAKAVDRLAAAISHNRCALFLGAGVHVPPPHDSQFAYSEEERPPLARELAARLKQGLSDAMWFDEEPTLARVAQYYEIVYGRQELVSAIREALNPHKKPSSVVRGLAELDFPLVITTNYDRLFEQALVDAGKVPRVLCYTSRLYEAPLDVMDDPTPRNPLIFKIHGDVDQLDIVVTQEDYVQFFARMTDTGPTGPVPLSIRFYLSR